MPIKDLPRIFGVSTLTVMVLSLVAVPTISVYAVTSQNASGNIQNTTSTSNASSIVPIPIPVPIPALVTMPSFHPPPGYEQARNVPSYAVRIPYSPEGLSQFDPPSISVPANMTVIWFNDDQSPHSVTVNESSSQAKPNTSFDSGMISPGGSFLHKFNSPGTYAYYDRVNPFAKGKVSVGDSFENGKNMDMLVGGNVIPFNASKLSRLTVSFVPHGNVATIPPKVSIAYNVTIANSTSVLFSHQFVDIDGILDLELIPVSKANNTKDFEFWGPDLTDRAAGEPNYDGTFHIQGPVLVDNSVYLIRVQIVAKDGQPLSSPITDVFALPSVSGK